MTHFWTRNLRQSNSSDGPTLICELTITVSYPICSMYGIFTYIYPTTGPNVGKYTIHGASGNINMVDFFPDVLQWDEGGRHPATSLWKNCDAVGETRNWNHHFAQQIRFPCWVFSVLFLSGFSYRWRLRLYKLAMMMATVFSGSDKLLRAPAGLEEKSQCPSNSLSGWMDPAQTFCLGWYFGMVKLIIVPIWRHPFFLWWLRKSRGWPFR